MTNGALILSISETMTMLMKSSGIYVYNRLTTHHGREAYRVAMKECISYVSCGLESMEMIKARIEGFKAEAEHLYPKRLFNSRYEERRCHHMAINQALNIVNTLEARFITGQCDSEPRGYKNRGYIYNSNYNIFD